MRTLLLVFCASLAACSAGSTYDPYGDASVPDSGEIVTIGDGGTGTVAVQIDRTTVVGSLPTGFGGLSFEKSALAEGFFTGTNAPLITLLRRLGPGVLHIGGSSVDRLTWEAGEGVPDAGATSALVPANVDALSAFLVASGWRVLYGLNFQSSTPDAAGAEAGYVAGKLGSRLVGFELGDEVDRYSSTAQNASWSYAAFSSQWPEFAAAVRTAAPSAPIFGPAAAQNVTSWTIPFAHQEAALIGGLTQHYYRDDTPGAASLPALLTADPNLSSLLGQLQTVAASTATSYRIDQANSYSNGGKSGISNSVGAELWALDFLLTAARYGAAAVDFHGDENDPSSPIGHAGATVANVGPDYYALLQLAQVGAGALVEVELGGDAASNVSAYALVPTGSPGPQPSVSPSPSAAPTGSSIAVILINKAAATTVSATVDLGDPVHTASALTFTGPSLSATSGFLLGGAAVEVTGTWMPNWVSLPVEGSGGSRITVTVPAASAVLISVD